MDKGIDVASGAVPPKSERLFRQVPNFSKFGPVTTTVAFGGGNKVPGAPGWGGGQSPSPVAPEKTPDKNTEK